MSKRKRTVTTVTENISEDQLVKNNKDSLLILEKTKDSRKHLKCVALRAYSGQKKSNKAGIDDEQITELLPMVHRIVKQVVTYLRPPL